MKHLLTGTLFLLFLCSDIKANHNVLNFNSADNLALNTPQYIAENMESLVAYGQANTQSELEMTRFLFVWLAQNIHYDSSELYALKRTTSKQLSDSVFLNRKGICRGYADLLTLLCQKAGIYARTVTGYAKSSGDKADSTDFHAWNAIRVSGQWHLFDVTWASNYLERTKEVDSRFDQYFQQSSENFTKRHFPFDPIWQLNNQIIPRYFFFSDTVTNWVASDYFKDYYKVLEEESTMSSLEQNLYSFERAVAFIPQEKRLHDALNYYKSEKAHDLFEKANVLLDKFRNKSDAELRKWTSNDYKNMIADAQEAKGYFEKTMKIYESMTYIGENEDTESMKSNMVSIHKNKNLTDKLINYLQDIASDTKQLPIARVSKRK